jgi:hypothetical protein
MMSEATRHERNEKGKEEWTECTSRNPATYSPQHLHHPETSQSNFGVWEDSHQRKATGS